ncbi:hypothetical protein HU200_051026 [Digitaria exilis]|uniref:DUF6598 domain-containing protein n=1 Tax=Digitaria exilis TaxID=1010633 RepID=A0A835EAJ0_9POAL|nr:hypothetical protein HU200_051026 [Digitaria exilis]
MSMKFNCLIEVDIRVKAIEDDDTEDKTLADGCMELIEGRVVLETLCRCTLSGPYGSVAFDYIIFESGFEATIELDFLEVPEGGFSMQMCGYTSAQKNYYAFIDKNCDCDNVVSSTGRFPQYFVAAVQKDDYFLVDFAEGKSPLILKPMGGFVEKLGPVEHEERLASIKTSFGIPSEPEHTFRFHALPEGTRDKRHVGDRVWHEYYHMSGFLEIDIRVKAIGDDDTEDKTLADGCMELIEDQVSFETLCRCIMSCPYGFVAFDFIIFRWGFEATIELDFLEVPEGGFSMQMCGYTTAQKNYYTFIDKNCDCDGVVSLTGRFPQYFVAAVQKDDYFLVDFAEGKSPLIFKPSIHGSEAKEYSFCNGAVVLVKVSWSTAFYCG